MATFDSSGGRKLKPTTPVRPKVKAKSKAAAKPRRPPAPPPVDPMDAQVIAATALQYGEADRALAGQRAVHQQQTAALPGYFQQYQDALRQATQVTAGAYGNAAAIQQNAANTTSVLDAQQQAALTGQMRTDAQARGATVDPAIAAQAQQAAMARRSTADAFTGLTGTLGAAETGFRANRQVVGAGQRLTAQRDEMNRGAAIEQQAGQLGREKGAFAVTAKQKLQDAAHTKKLEEAAFGLSVQKAETDVASDQARLDEARRARETSDRNADQTRDLSAERVQLQREKDAYQRRNKLGPYAPRAAKAGGATAQQKKDAAKIRNNINTAAADARTLRGANVDIEDPKTRKPTGKTRKMTESEIRAQLRKRYKDADIANAAMDLAIKGYVSAENQRRLKDRGIKLPASWLPKRKPKAKGLAGLITGGGSSMSSKPPAGSGLK